jgi:hypothetical protein
MDSGQNPMIKRTNPFPYALYPNEAGMQKGIIDASVRAIARHVAKRRAAGRDVVGDVASAIDRTKQIAAQGKKIVGQVGDVLDDHVQAGTIAAPTFPVVREIGRRMGEFKTTRGRLLGIQGARAIKEGIPEIADPRRPRVIEGTASGSSTGASRPSWWEGFVRRKRSASDVRGRAAATAESVRDRTEADASAALGGATPEGKTALDALAEQGAANLTRYINSKTATRREVGQGVATAAVSPRSVVKEAATGMLEGMTNPESDVDHPELSDEQLEALIKELGRSPSRGSWTLKQASDDTWAHTMPNLVQDQTTGLYGLLIPGRSGIRQGAIMGAEHGPNGAITERGQQYLDDHIRTQRGKLYKEQGDRYDRAEREASHWNLGEYTPINEVDMPPEAQKGPLRSEWFGTIGEMASHLAERAPEFLGPKYAGIIERALQTARMNSKKEQQAYEPFGGTGTGRSEVENVVGGIERPIGSSEYRPKRNMTEDDIEKTSNHLSHDELLNLLLRQHMAHMVIERNSRVPDDAGRLLKLSREEAAAKGREKDWDKYASDERYRGMGGVVPWPSVAHAKGKDGARPKGFGIYVLPKEYQPQGITGKPLSHIESGATLFRLSPHEQEASDYDTAHREFEDFLTHPLSERMHFFGDPRHKKRAYKDMARGKYSTSYDGYWGAENPLGEPRSHPMEIDHFPRSADSLREEEIREMLFHAMRDFRGGTERSFTSRIKRLGGLFGTAFGNRTSSPKIWSKESRALFDTDDVDDILKTKAVPVFTDWITDAKKRMGRDRIRNATDEERSMSNKDKADYWLHHKILGGEYASTPLAHIPYSEMSSRLRGYYKLRAAKILGTMKEIAGKKLADLESGKKIPTLVEWAYLQGASPERLKDIPHSSERRGMSGWPDYFDGFPNDSKITQENFVDWIKKNFGSTEKYREALVRQYKAEQYKRTEYEPSYSNNFGDDNLFLDLLHIRNFEKGMKQFESGQTEVNPVEQMREKFLHHLMVRKETPNRITIRRGETYFDALARAARQGVEKTIAKYVSDVVKTGTLVGGRKMLQQAAKTATARAAVQFGQLRQEMKRWMEERKKQIEKIKKEKQQNEEARARGEGPKPAQEDSENWRSPTGGNNMSSGQRWRERNLAQRADLGPPKTIYTPTERSMRDVDRNLDRLLKAMEKAACCKVCGKKSRKTICDACAKKMKSRRG